MIKCVVKLSSNGIPQWYLSWSKSENDNIGGMVVDSLEHIYIAGQTLGSHQNYRDVFLTKLLPGSTTNRDVSIFEFFIIYSSITLLIIAVFISATKIFRFLKKKKGNLRTGGCS